MTELEFPPTLDRPCWDMDPDEFPLEKDLLEMPGSLTAVFEVSSKCAFLPVLCMQMFQLSLGSHISSPRVEMYWPAFTR